MRKIKFRAWDKKEKRMFKVHGLSWHFGIFLIEEDGRSQKHGSGETEIMQYTGLKDKNGKEIYEGDIYLPPDGVKRVIEFRDGCFTEKNSYPTSPITLGGEVIGNLYENTELKVLKNEE